MEFQDASDAADAVDNMDGMLLLLLFSTPAESVRATPLVLLLCAESEFYGRVLTVNFARPLQNKLGTTRPVWDDIDEYNKLKEQIVAGEIASDGPTRLAAAPDEDAAAEPDVDE